MIKRLVRAEEKLTQVESANLEQFCRALGQVAAGKSQAARKKGVEAGLGGIAAICQRLFSETSETGDEGGWCVRQEVEPLLRQTRLILTATTGTLWLYLDRQAQPWAGGWFEPKAEAVGFNLKAAASGCQFCLLQGTVRKELVLERTAEDLGWTTDPDPGTPDDWADLSGQPDEASPAWLFESETPVPRTETPSVTTTPEPAAGTHQPPVLTPPSPLPVMQQPKRAAAPPPPPPPMVKEAVCSRCGNPLRPGIKFCGSCGQPV